MKKLIIFLTLLLPSCGLFYIDSSPAIEGRKAQAKIFVDQAESFASLIKNANGLDPTAKELILIRISQSIKDYEEIELEQLEFLKSIDNENYEKIIAEIKVLFETLRGKYQW